MHSIASQSIDSAVNGIITICHFYAMIEDGFELIEHVRFNFNLNRD